MNPRSPGQDEVTSSSRRLASRPMPSQPVDVRISARTLVSIVGVGALIALALLSLGTLVSILLAAVLAFGLDPVVGALVARGWRRGHAALASFAALFVAVFVLVVVTAGPVWDQIVEFVHAIPGYWEELTSKPGVQDIMSTADASNRIAEALKQLAAGLPDAASALLGLAGGRVRLGPLARHARVPRALPADGAPDDHRLAVRLHGARDRRALAPGGRGVDPGDLHVADRQHRHLGRRGHGGRRCRRGRSGCRSRSCWP